MTKNTNMYRVVTTLIKYVTTLSLLMLLFELDRNS